MKHPIQTLFLLTTSIVLLSCNSTKNTISETVKGTWISVESTDGSEAVERHEAAFVGVKDKFYLLGGRGEKATSVYDAKSKKWTQAAEPPIEIHHFQPVVYEDKIYILGAMTGGYPGETPVPAIQIYDPAKDEWQKGATIPEDRRRGGAGAVLYKDKIYLVCGIKDGHRGDHKKWLDLYDPKTGKWEKLPDAPRPRDHFQAIVADDKLYLLGGRTTIAAENPFKNTMTEVDVYDFKKGTWTTLENGLPTLRAGNYATLLGNEILVMGGESFTQVAAHSEVEALNVNTHTWRTLAPMLNGRHGTGVVNYKQKMYVASGSGNRGGGPELKTMECLSFQ